MEVSFRLLRGCIAQGVLGMFMAPEENAALAGRPGHPTNATFRRSTGQHR